MKKLLNTLFITQPNTYLALNGNSVVLWQEDEQLARIPLLNLESIVTFSHTGASSALMGYCARKDISIVFLSPNGKFRARLVGKSRGNVLLRKEQYRASDDLLVSCQIARNFIEGKVFNSKWMIERVIREHRSRVDVKRLRVISHDLSKMIKEIKECENLRVLRGFEGQAAFTYFQVFDQMILQQKPDFFFNARSRRPPRDRVNCMMSFAYTLLANDVEAALETVGLDAYVGFLHRDRPGRVSLALDVMEELRGVIADRFVLSLINKRMMKKDDFFEKDNGAIWMSDTGRKKFLAAWQRRKQEELRHPYLKRKMTWGLVPYVQSLLLARYLRGDSNIYPPFLWK